MKTYGEIFTFNLLLHLLEESLQALNSVLCISYFLRLVLDVCCEDNLVNFSPLQLVTSSFLTRSIIRSMSSSLPLVDLVQDDVGRGT